MALTRAPSWEAIIVVSAIAVTCTAGGWGSGFWMGVNSATTGARLDQLEKRVDRLERAGK